MFYQRPAFVTCRLRSCNSLFNGVQIILSSLQRLQHTASGALPRSDERGHVTSGLPSHHWLPIRSGRGFQIPLGPDQGLGGPAPSCLQGGTAGTKPSQQIAPETENPPPRPTVEPGRLPLPSQNDTFSVTKPHNKSFPCLLSLLGGPGPGRPGDLKPILIVTAAV